MKLALGSDVHLEFGDINLQNTENADVLILGGDIMIAQELHDHPYIDPALALINLGSIQKRAKLYREFLQRCSDEFPHTVYVAGNHEFYHGKFHGSLDDLYNECGKFSNVYFLENQTKQIADTHFIGCTLWTDMNKYDPVTLHSVGDMMNDYRIIRNDSRSYAKLRPVDTAARHRHSLEYIKKTVEKDPDHQYVVVGHMAPSTLSTHPKYADDKIMNGAYSSDLSEFILDHPQIKVWTHGHTHHRFDYMVGNTRVVCNPRGYIGYEKQADDFALQFLEL